MSCLDGLIGDDNGCATRTGRLYLRDIGITEDFIGAILKKEDASSSSFMADRRRLATEFVTRDVLTHYDKQIIGATFIDRDRVGKYPDTETLLTGDASYAQGIMLEVCTPNSNTRLLVTRVEFYGETTGDVVVTFHDLRDGTVLATKTIDAIAGQVSTIEVDLAFQCLREKKRILITTDQDVYYRSQLGSNCPKCAKGSYDKGILKGRSMRVLTSDKYIYNNMLPAQDCGGLSVIATVECDSYGWLCEVKASLALPLIYLLGYEIFTMALYNFERYNIQNLRKQDVVNRRDELKALYGKSMDDLFRTMPLPNDPYCFACDSRTSTGVILP